MGSFIIKFFIEFTSSLEEVQYEKNEVFLNLLNFFNETERNSVITKTTQNIILIRISTEPWTLRRL